MTDPTEPSEEGDVSMEPGSDVEVHSERRVIFHGRRSEDGIITVHVKEKVLTPTFILLCIAVLTSSLGALGIYIDNKDDEKIIRQTQATAENTNRVVQSIEEQQSPAAIAEAEARIDRIILRVECNEREVLTDFSEDLLAQLAQVGVLPESAEVTIEIPEECRPFIDPEG